MMVESRSRSSKGKSEELESHVQGQEAARKQKGSKRLPSKEGEDAVAMRMCQRWHMPQRGGGEWRRGNG